MRFASSKFWHGKQVLLTGHTGFKGAWMSLWLAQMGANVTGVSLSPKSMPNLFTLANIAKSVDSYFIDIRDGDRVASIVDKVKPEIVLHLAAQALVRSGYKNPVTTFDTNIMGTVNILNSLRGVASVKVAVVVTSDKVYQNLEHNKPYSETNTLGGYDPYSASKAACELIVSSYRDSFFSEQGIVIASARAGNVIGGGDWSEDRLIPDAVRAWSSGLPLDIRRPNSVRPWQHVLESLNGYLVLAEKLYLDSSLAGAYNFGPNIQDSASVKIVIELANQAFGRGSVNWGGGEDGPHEAGLLTLDASKAKEILDVEPIWSLEEALNRTMKWYQQHNTGTDATFLCEADISAFTSRQSIR